MYAPSENTKMSYRWN